MRFFFTFFCSLITASLFSQKQFEIFFDFNQEVPNQKSVAALHNWMNANQNAAIIKIEGYCDSVDNSLYNKELARKRINTVLKLLRKNQFAITEDIVINPVGEDFVHSRNQAENRKVIFTYLEKINMKTVTLAESKAIEVVEASFEDPVEVERSSLADKFEKAKIGDRIAIYNINFIFNSESIEAISEPLLDELLFILERNPKMAIKIHGHICCNPNPYNTKLSYRRALKIFKHLKDKGIQQNRLAYNGVGSNNPIYPIPEKNEEQRIANRRVEIEIVRK
jgi:outer membrane protein OmpA-like peptidoglycan-associated protein